MIWLEFWEILVWMKQNLMACVWVLNVSHGRDGAKFEVEEEKLGGKCNLGEFWNKFIDKSVKKFTSLFISLFDINKFDWWLVWAKSTVGNDVHKLFMGND